MIRGTLLAGLVVLLIPWSLARPQDKPAAKDTTPRVVTLKELIAAIKEQKGKVVVVDFWADT